MNALPAATAAKSRNEAIGRLRAEMKPPSLQELVERHGTYDKVAPEAWAAFDRDMAIWKSRVRAGDFHRPPYSDLPPESELRR